MPATARHAIQNLMYQYAHAIDDGRFEEVAELFRHARILGPDGSASAEGYAGVLALYEQSTRRYLPDQRPCTQHIISNIYLRLSDDMQQANAESSFTVFQQTDELPLQPIIAGSYKDSFVKHESEWRFAQRQMLPKLYGDLSHHLLITLAARPND